MFLKNKIKKLYSQYIGAGRENEEEDERKVEIRLGMFKTLHSKACLYDELKTLLFGE